VNTNNRLKYFLTNKIFFITGDIQVHTYDFHCKMCNNNTFFIACVALWWKSVIFIVLSSTETVYDTVQYRYCIFSLLNRLLRTRLKRQNPLLSYVQEKEREREREKVHCKCTM
jgi:hypothetical protein